MEDRSDIYQRVTNQIIAAIEAGTETSAMPWHANDGLPINLASGKHYRGVNTLSLWAIAEMMGYSAPVWATYGQWADEGCQVRKGEKAAAVVFWKIFEPVQQTPETGQDAEDGRRFMARGYSVFNVAQVDGYEAAQTAPNQPLERVPQMDKFLSATGADIRHGGSKAFYSPKADYIQIPSFAAFKSVQGYYSVLTHELTHWTGKPGRCERDLSGRFGNEAYAAEELVAELGAAFLCSSLGLVTEPRPDHAAYIQTWLKVLKNDNRAIFTAASKAQQAADWLHSLAG